jgi:hypothetical protein
MNALTKYVKRFRNAYNAYNGSPLRVKKGLMDSGKLRELLAQYNQARRLVKKYAAEEKKQEPIELDTEKDRILDRAMVVYNAAETVLPEYEIKGQMSIPMVKLSIPSINLADAKSGEVRAELELEKKAAEDINKQIDTFTITKVGANKINAYNDALIVSGMTSENDRKRAIRRVFFSAIQAKLKDEVGILIRLYKLEGTSIESDINQMLEKQTQPTMIEEFNPMDFLKKAKEYISTATSTATVALGVEEGKVLNIDEKIEIQAPLKVLNEDVKTEEKVIQLNKRIVKARIEEAIKYHDGSLNQVLNPSIRRMNNLPENILQQKKIADIHGDSKRILCNYATSYN